MKILIVEDEQDFRDTICGLLQDKGYLVRPTASDGEALAAILEDSFDFVFMDMRLHNGGEEDISGLSLALAFRFIRPEAHLVILSGHQPKTKTMLRVIKYLGAVLFVEKDGNWQEQIQSIIESHDDRDEKGYKAHISISLALGQSLVIRSHGRHVCSMRTPKILQIGVDRYTRRTDLARRSLDSLRFQVGEIGYDLWRDLFGGHSELHNAYLEARAKSQALSLSFETSRDFLRLPIEFIRTDQPPDYLALQHPLTRFLCDASPKREVISPQFLATKKDLRVLLIASNTKPTIDGVDLEIQELYQYLATQTNLPIRAKRIPTERATYEYIKTELKKRSYDIIHYAGHGVYRPESPEKSGLLFWSEENKQGVPLSLEASELKMLLENSEARLVYLSCCFGGEIGSQAALQDDDFLGLLDAIAQAGIPSALGFRWPVSDMGSRTFAKAFYRSLLESGSPTIGLWDARRELAGKNRDDPTWLSPLMIHQE